MTQKLINTGTSANKGDGDPLRLAFEKINDNFTELYTGSPIVPQDLRGSVFGDDSTLLVDGVNSSIPKANIEDSTNWDTAFGWGNHSTAGYLTSYTVTESDVTTHQAALSITESQITDLAHYDDTALATRVTTLENAGYITSETDSQELTLVGTDLSISSGNTVDLSGFLTSVPAQTFASLTGTPTTIAGYGITDALALGTTATTALAGDTALFDSTTSEVAIGSSAGETSQGTKAVAIGENAGKTSQGNFTVAVGDSAGLTGQGAGGIAIGPGAGMTTQGVETIAIGANSGMTTQGENALAIGSYVGVTSQGVSAVAVGNRAGGTSQGEKSIAIGYFAGVDSQGDSAVAIGENAGQTTQGTSAVAIGKNAGIGGTTTATYVSGGEADTTLIVDDTTGIKVGSRVSGTGFLTQVNRQPRVLSVDNGTTLTIEYTSDSTPSGVLTFNAQQYNFAIGIGEDAGAYGQQDYTVALGYGAGNFVQDEQAIAIGPAAGNNNQGLGGVAVGSQAGETNQDSHGIAVGKWAGRSDQANEAIAIGYQAGYTGQGAHAIAIGQDAGKTSQAAQSIVLNATGSILDNTQQDSFVVKPVRSVSGGTLPAGFKQVGYNPTTGEFIYLDGV